MRRGAFRWRDPADTNAPGLVSHATSTMQYMASRDVRRRNHVVTRGYLAHFGKRRGSTDYVNLHDLATGETRSDISTRTVFRTKDFTVFRTADGLDDSLERQWADVVEGPALVAVRELTSPEDLTPEREMAVKALAAMHIARSYGLKALFDEHWEDRLAEPQDAEALRDAFRDQYGHDPAPGEIAQMWRQEAERRRHANIAFTSIMVDMYHKTFDHLVPKAVQLVHTRTRRFITSDNPVVLSNPPRTGIMSGVGIASASLMWLPLTAHLAAAFPSEPQEHLVANPAGVRQLNFETARNALRFIVFHPDDELASLIPGGLPEPLTTA